jgi:hypothetical protein
MHDAWPCAHALEISSHIGIDREVNLRRHACPVQDRCQIAVRDAEAVEQEFPVFNLASRQARRGAYLSPPPKRSPIRTFTASLPRRLTGRSGVRAPVRRCVFDGRIDGGRRSAPARPRGVSDDPYVVDPCARPYSPTSPRGKSAAARIAPPKNSRPRSSAISTLSTQSPSPSSGPSPPTPVSPASSGSAPLPSAPLKLRTQSPQLQNQDTRRRCCAGLRPGNQSSAFIISECAPGESALKTG